MFGPPGVAYVYLIYGMHHCLNVVTVGEGVPEAILIRGGRPIAGVDLVRQRRGVGVGSAALADGPGTLCQALAITRKDDGVDLCESKGGITIHTDGITVPEDDVQRLPRVGVDYAGEAAAWPLRLKLSLRLR